VHVQPIHARYTPFIQRAIERAKRDCKLDAAMRAGDPGGPYKHIADADLDLTTEAQHWIVTGASFDFVVHAAALSGDALLEQERRKKS
jgi:hypothetical protein